MTDKGPSHKTPRWRRRLNEQWCKPTLANKLCPVSISSNFSQASEQSWRGCGGAGSFLRSNLGYLWEWLSFPTSRQGQKQKPWEQSTIRESVYPGTVEKHLMLLELRIHPMKLICSKVDSRQTKERISHTMWNVSMESAATSDCDDLQHQIP